MAVVKYMPFMGEASTDRYSLKDHVQQLVDRYAKRDVIRDAVHREVARYAERWITINGGSKEDGEGGGTPVKIDDDGTIVAGPKGLADKGVKKLSDFGKKSNKTPDKLTSKKQDWRSDMAGKPLWQRVETMKAQPPHELTADEYVALKEWEHGDKPAQWEKDPAAASRARQQSWKNEHTDLSESAYMSGKTVAEKPRWTVKRSDYDNGPEEHRMDIEKAVKERKPVPPEVLADYPDLQSQVSGTKPDAKSPRYVAKGNEIFDADGKRHAAFRNEEKAKAAAEEWNKNGRPGESKPEKVQAAKDKSTSDTFAGGIATTPEGNREQTRVQVIKDFNETGGYKNGKPHEGYYVSKDAKKAALAAGYTAEQFADEYLQHNGDQLDKSWADNVAYLPNRQIDVPPEVMERAKAILDDTGKASETSAAKTYHDHAKDVEDQLADKGLEIGRDRTGKWTAFRNGDDDKGPYQDHIGQSFDSYDDAADAALKHDWDAGKEKKPRTLKDVQDEHYEANKAMKAAGKALLDAAGLYKKNDMDVATKKTTIGAAMEFTSHTIDTALKSTKVPRELKDAYREARDRVKQLEAEGDELADTPNPADTGEGWDAEHLRGNPQMMTPAQRAARDAYMDEQERAAEAHREKGRQLEAAKKAEPESAPKEPASFGSRFASHKASGKDDFNSTLHSLAEHLNERGANVTPSDINRRWSNHHVDSLKGNATDDQIKSAFEASVGDDTKDHPHMWWMNQSPTMGGGFTSADTKDRDMEKRRKELLEEADSLEKDAPILKALGSDKGDKMAAKAKRYRDAVESNRQAFKSAIAQEKASNEKAAADAKEQRRWKPEPNDAKGMTPVQLAKRMDEGTGRNFAKMLKETGWYTDQKIAIKPPEKIRDQILTKSTRTGQDGMYPKHIVDMAEEAGRTKNPPMRSLGERSVETEATKKRAGSIRHETVLADDDGNHVTVDSKYLRTIQKMYPQATFHSPDRKNGPIVVKNSGDVIGLLMPLGGGDKDPETEAHVKQQTGARRATRYSNLAAMVRREVDRYARQAQSRS